MTGKPNSAKTEQEQIKELSRRFIQGESNWELEDDLRSRGYTSGQARTLVGQAMSSVAS
jgi:hypothetical protein